MCLILPEKKGRTSLCRELRGGRRDAGVDAVTQHSCPARSCLALAGAEDDPDHPCRSRDASYCTGSGRVGLEELPGASRRVPAGLGSGHAAVQGAGSSAGLGGAGEVLLALLPSPRCSISAEEPCTRQGRERHALIFFFPLLPLAPGLEKAGKGRCSPEG